MDDVEVKNKIRVLLAGASTPDKSKGNKWGYVAGVLGGLLIAGYASCLAARQEVRSTTTVIIESPREFADQSIDGSRRHHEVVINPRQPHHF